MHLNPIGSFETNTLWVDDNLLGLDCSALTDMAGVTSKSSPKTTKKQQPSFLLWLISSTLWSVLPQEQTRQYSAGAAIPIPLEEGLFLPYWNLYFSLFFPYFSHSGIITQKYQLAFDMTAVHQGVTTASAGTELLKTTEL